MRSFCPEAEGHLMPEPTASEVSFSQSNVCPVTEQLCSTRAQERCGAWGGELTPGPSGRSNFQGC